MKLQERINEIIRAQSAERTEFMEAEYKETYGTVEKITRTLKFLFEAKWNNILEDLQGVSANDQLEKALSKLDDTYSELQVITEERSYYKGLRDGLKLASNFEIMGLPMHIKLLDKPQIQLQITDVDSPGDNEPV